MVEAGVGGGMLPEGAGRFCHGEEIVADFVQQFFPLTLSHEQVEAHIDTVHHVGLFDVVHKAGGFVAAEAMHEQVIERGVILGGDGTEPESIILADLGQVIGLLQDALFVTEEVVDKEGAVETEAKNVLADPPAFFDPIGAVVEAAGVDEDTVIADVGGDIDACDMIGVVGGTPFDKDP